MFINPVSFSNFKTNSAKFVGFKNNSDRSYFNSIPVFDSVSFGSKPNIDEKKKRFDDYQPIVVDFEDYKLPVHNPKISYLMQKEYTPDDVTDYQTFKLGSDTASVEVTSIAANGTEMDTQTISPENYTAAICFDTGGQILGSKILRFDWEE